MLTGITTIILTVLAAIYTAFILPSLQDYLKSRVARYAKQREEAEANRNKINLTYLNPLRLWLEEAYVRLSEISTTVTNQGTAPSLLFIEHPKDISNQEAEWFNGRGCYLISTCYITACLFFAIKQVRDNIPYLRLSRESDTELMTLLFRVSHAFLQDFGIFYVTQPSIGNDLYLPDRNRLMTYREFCELLKQPEKRIWFDRLFTFYIETGRGEKRERIQAALNAIRELSSFLDKHIGKGVAIEERLKAEGISKPANG
ncbi:MAG: hypothetical protein KME16_21235 [Scytolyngbya sp. HA4215-MV1]|jgi:hypothetical protein|nr:hypothetical protein [Scytolyngbya sp. HA4215-MV1]